MALRIGKAQKYKQHIDLKRKKWLIMLQDSDLVICVSVADAVDDPAPSEHPPLPAPSAPPLLEDVTHSQLNRLVDRLGRTPFEVRKTILFFFVAKN